MKMIKYLGIVVVIGLVIGSLSFLEDGLDTQVLTRMDRSKVNDPTRVRSLAPRWLMEQAAAAINAYNCGYRYTLPLYQPNWRCIGPTGKPDGGRATGNGQIHRIVFDPNYDAQTNFRVYAISSFGGVWKSDTEEVYWNNLNTDTQLPFASVSDMAVHPSKTDVLFLATGDGDYGRIFDHSFVEISGLRIAPTQTSGVYRSRDGGKNWEKINGPNNELCSTFERGGNIRRILIHPDMEDVAFIATTAGVFRSENILAKADDVRWVLVLDGQQVNDTEFRGLEVKPNSGGQIVYASGSGIYRSTDAGLHWSPMTTRTDNKIKGLDLSALPTGKNPLRINVAVTRADPDRLYAHIFGKNYDLSCAECKADCPGTQSCNGSACGNKKKWAWLYVFKDEQWHKVWEQNTCSSFYVPQRRWSSIAVSPINPNNVFIGNTVVWGNDQDISYQGLLGGKSIRKASMYNGTGIHADVHGLNFEPANNTQDHPRLWAATHGGVSINSYVGRSSRARAKKARAFKQRWKRVDQGLQVATIWDFDQSALHPEQIIIGTQDNGVIVQTGDSLSANIGWKSILGGDGYGAMFDGRNNNAWIKNQSNIYRYNYATGRKSIETKSLPTDPVGGTTFVRALNGHNHPLTGKFYTAFGELYERMIDYPKRGIHGDSIWKLRSDVGKVISGGWQREIYNFEISERDPNFMYIVCSGNDGTPPDDFATEPRLFRSTTGGCDGYSDYLGRDTTNPCFVEISLDGLDPQNPGDTRVPFITDVAIDPSNPNRIWVSFSGYDARLKVWSWEYDPQKGRGFWSNADPHNTLNNLPVNFISYQKGTDERLYIGTDAGVWLKDEGSERWQKYGDFPNVRVTGMKLNYSCGQLLVATWGRGVWVGDILPPTQDYPNPLVIKDTQLWKADRTIDRNLVLMDGANLTINGCTVGMATGAHIKLHPGAQLTIRSATLTNLCGQHWKGIKILTQGRGAKIKMPKIILDQSHILKAEQSFIFVDE